MYIYIIFKKNFQKFTVNIKHSHLKNRIYLYTQFYFALKKFIIVKINYIYLLLRIMYFDTLSRYI